MANEIVEIKTDPRNKNARLVLLDDGTRLSLGRQLLTKHGLRVGVSVDKDELTEIAREDELKRAKNYAYNLLVVRDHTSAEITRKLSGKGYSEDVINQVLANLHKHEYIKDERYARNWVQSRMRNNPRGRSLIKSELLKRGIDKDTIDSVLDEIDVSTEYDAALRAARKQMVHYEGLREVVIRRRMYGFLSRRGFESQLIKKIIDRVLEERSNDRKRDQNQLP